MLNILLHTIILNLLVGCVRCNATEEKVISVTNVNNRSLDQISDTSNTETELRFIDMLKYILRKNNEREFVSSKTSKFELSTQNVSQMSTWNYTDDVHTKYMNMMTTETPKSTLDHSTSIAEHINNNESIDFTNQIHHLNSSKTESSDNESIQNYSKVNENLFQSWNNLNVTISSVSVTDRIFKDIWSLTKDKEHHSDSSNEIDNFVEKDVQETAVRRQEESYFENSTKSQSSQVEKEMITTLESVGRDKLVDKVSDGATTVTVAPSTFADEVNMKYSKNITRNITTSSGFFSMLGEYQSEQTSPLLSTQLLSYKIYLTSTPSVTTTGTSIQTPRPFIEPSTNGHQVIPLEIRLAWLAPLGWKEGFSAETTVNVLKRAIIDSARFLPHTSIRVKWYDTKCDAKAALAAAVDARRDFDPDLILGPPCSIGMSGVAMLASHWNLPVFGWVSNHHSLVNRSTYSTLVRVLGPLNQLSYTMHFVTLLFRWRRFAMIYDVDSAYSSVNAAITLYLNEKNNTITSQHSVYSSKPDSEIHDIFQQVRKYARVIVFSVPWMTMRKYMLVAHKLGMTNGDFSFICINGDVYTNTTLHRDVLSDAGWRRHDSHDDDARIAFESVIHVIMATSNISIFATFTEYVLNAEKLQSPLWELPVGKETMDAYAPFIYDATVLWASLVNRTLQQGGDPRNGSNIFRLARKQKSSGVTGKLDLDDNCDRLSNVLFLDMQPDGKFADFAQIDNDLEGGYLTSLQTKHGNVDVRWRDGTSGSSHAPPDTPSCGFEGEYCQQSTYKNIPDYTDSIVGAAAGSSFVFIVAVLVQMTLRRYRRRRQLESMLWQVKFEEIDFLTAILSGSVRASFRNLARRRTPSNKKLSKSEKTINYNENSPRKQHLFEADAVMFGSVAYVRGSLVSVKRITRTNISLTKELLQQLNKLMELKHQNITAFVGACADPGRFLLLWEYCPKGSLQDIILNQNIKLDNLFKFALCQDVAKGLDYIHKSYVNYHGNLKSTNCVVDSRWTCKLTDFGVPRLRSSEKTSVSSEESTDGFWTAPEIMRAEREVDFQKADIFALGIIFKEVFTRTTPYTDFRSLNSTEIARRVMRPDVSGVPLRPSVDNDITNNFELCQLIFECWADDAGLRPSATRVLKTLSRLNPSNISAGWLIFVSNIKFSIINS